MVLKEVLATSALWPVETVATGALLLGEEPRTVTTGPADKVFALASVTKPLVAYAVMVAVEEGALELDEELPPGASVRQLLSHTGGVGFASRALEKAPGQRRIYSSAGYEILAEAVARATDMPFEEYFHEALCVPLGMTSTTLAGSAGHGARSTVGDLLRFAAEVLHPQLLHPSTVAEMLHPQGGDVDGIVPGYGAFRPCPWGLGFELKGVKNPHWTGAAQPPHTAGHFGQAGTFLWVDVEERVAAVALTDRDFGPWAKPVWSPWNDAVFAALRAAQN
nr:serine hydrolase domain-containing protein [Corynebacterium sp. 13CS0277]